ncbi:MAG TPA: alpha/beta hydrolase [Chloroflexota bacterium]|nr:alpha/beta hydrolase [Chloroflexota bacterium]
MSDVRDGRVAVRWQNEPLELAYREWPGHGAPIVLLHGLASNKGIWNLVAERLAPTWRVVALDQRGHGLSDKPNGGYDFATMADDLRQAFAALGIDRPLLVGHSWGGNVALDFAANVRPGPRALALVDGGFIELSRRMTWEEAQERLRPPHIEMPVAELKQRMRDRLGDRWTPAWEEATLGNFWVDEVGVVHRNLAVENHMRILCAMYGQRPSELFTRVECPTYLIPADPPADAPQRDASWRADREAFLRLAEQALGGPPKARTFWMRETVHDVPLHRPDELAALLGELAAVP